MRQQCCKALTYLTHLLEYPRQQKNKQGNQYGRSEGEGKIAAKQFKTYIARQTTYAQLFQPGQEAGKNHDSDKNGEYPA
jgi:hypothetical protein